MCHIGHEEEFLRDLRAAVEEVKSRPPGAKEGKAAVYGMASSLPRILHTVSLTTLLSALKVLYLQFFYLYNIIAGPISELLKVYNDVILDL